MEIFMSVDLHLHSVYSLSIGGRYNNVGDQKAYTSKNFLGSEGGSNHRPMSHTQAKSIIITIN